MELNKIYNGNCIDVMKQLPNGSVNMVLTSPPYDNLRSYNGYEFDYEQVIKELYRVVADGGVVVRVVNDGIVKGSETGTSFRQALYFKEIGFNLHDTMIRAKDTFNFPDNTRYGQSFEYMFVFSKGRPSTINKICDRKNIYGGTSVHGTNREKDGTLRRKTNHNKTMIREFGERFNVWHISGEKQNKTGHPAVFPLQLAKDHILSRSNEGDIVLDPMCGSGTTCLAAKELGRNYIGIDISKEYCEIAEKRLL